MPFIHIRMLGTATREQKSQVAAEFTETMQRVLGKPPEQVWVVMEEVTDENWAGGGVLVADRKTKGSS